MLDEDRIFLTEFASKTCYTHPATALALYRAAVDADEIGIVVESFMHVVDRSEAETIAERSGTAALVQTYVVARLLAQLAAAIEDCAALGDAIRFRDRRGLFTRYLASKSAVAGDFFDDVRRGLSLAELLAIPDLSALTLVGEDLGTLARDYEILPRALRDVADIYRGEGVPREWTDLGPNSNGEAPDAVNIVIDVIPTGSAVPRVTLLEAYNKIKHRFAVIDDIAPLGAAARAAGESVIFATYPRDPSQGELLFRNTVAVAQASGEMAALLLKLDALAAV
jgi:hypothetical protein